MANRLKVFFDACTPTPANGYRLYYRVKDSGGSYTLAGNFIASPAEVLIEGDPNGTAYEGYLQSDCGSGVLGNQVPFTNEVVFAAFDFLVVRFAWVSTAGIDLDIITGFIDTGITAIDAAKDATNNTANKWVGYGNNAAIPVGGTIDNSYAFWALDNTTNNGVEAVLISFDKVVQDFGGSIVGNEIKFNLNAVWYNAIQTGAVAINLTTYLGGTMSKVGTNIVNTGGTEVNNINMSATVTPQNHNANYTTSQTVGVVRYNKLTKEATLLPS